MRRLLVAAGFLLVLAAGLLAWLEGVSWARQARLEADQRGRAEARLEALEERIGVLRREWERMIEELRRQSEVRHIEEELRGGREASRPAASAPSAEELARRRGLQETMGTLNRLLARSGWSRLRFFAIGGISGQALLDVALHHLGPEGIVGEAIRAERLFLVLDAGRGELRLFSPRGRRLEGEVWVEFGPEGWELLLDGIDPEPWQSLGLGVVEVIPPPPAPPPATVPAAPPVEAWLWLDRLNLLLQGAPGLQGRRYRLARLGGLAAAGFQGVDLLGYSPKGLLQERFHADELLAARAPGGGVALLLRGGWHQPAAEPLPLPPAGYLLLLPGAAAEEWARVLGPRLLAAPPKQP